MTVTIYHNPDCATSRDVLALIRNSGVEPRVVEYLKAPPSRDELVELLRRMDIPPRAVSFFAGSWSDAHAVGAGVRPLARAPTGSAGGATHVFRTRLPGCCSGDAGRVMPGSVSSRAKPDDTSWTTKSAYAAPRMASTAAARRR